MKFCEKEALNSIPLIPIKKAIQHTCEMTGVSWQTMFRIKKRNNEATVSECFKSPKNINPITDIGSFDCSVI